MCGIVAQVGENINKIGQMSALAGLRHRGPDSEGTWNSPGGSAWLGHRRLSIVDLSDAGRQPMHNEDSTLWLVCNGEIYNFPSLRARLEGLGHRFYSHCDNEVILHAYEAWGDQAVDYLEGMFAFVLWDEKRQRLFAARDRVGIKPLYYAETEQGLILASETGALLNLLNKKPEPEPTSLAYVMTLGYVPSPWSVWRGINKLEPGHYVTWQAETGVKRQQYWEPPTQLDSEHRSDKAWQNIFEDVLSEHLLSDVEIGLFLSGGLDSSSVAAGLKDIGHSLQTMTVSFPESDRDEGPLATQVARNLGCQNELIPIVAQDVKGLVSEVMQSFDEPQGYSALLSMYVISKAAASRFKVVFSGDGGDEVFGGYEWYQNLGRISRWRSEWTRTRRKIISFRRGNDLPLQSRRMTVQFAQLSPLHLHASRLYLKFLPEEAQFLWSPTGLRFQDDEMLAPLRNYFEPKLPLKRALQRVDLMTFCSDSILAKVDRASMAHSLEVRVPFLDRRIIEWALSLPLPPDEDTESKPILRTYLRSRVNHSVLDHGKQGFSLRMLDRLDWNEAIKEIRKGYLVQNGYWTSDWEQLIQPGVPNRTGRIWNLLMLTSWANAWLDEQGESYARVFAKSA